MERIVTMVVRMGLNMLMRKGMRAGMAAMARRGGAPEAPSPEQRATADDAARRSQQAMRSTHRLWR